MKPYLRGSVWWVRLPSKHGGQRVSLGVSLKSAADARATFLAWVTGHAPTDLPLVLDRLSEAYQAWAAHQFPAWAARGQREASDPTLATLIQGWSAWMAAHGTPGPRQQVRALAFAEAFCRDTGLVHASDWTAKRTFQWLAGLPLAAPRRAQAALSSLAKYGIATGALTVNPTRGLPPLREPKPREQYLTYPDALQLVHGLPSGPERAYHALALYAPVERGAMFALTAGDVDVERRMVFARGTKTAWRTRWAWGLPAWGALWTDFEGWFKAQHFLPSARVFAATTDKRVRAALRSLPGYRIHDHRHSFGVAAAQAGIPYQDIANNLGHSNAGLAIKVYAKHRPSHSMSHTPLTLTSHFTGTDDA